MKLVLFVLLVSLVNSLVESRKNKRRRADETSDHKEPMHPAAFSLR